VRPWSDDAPADMRPEDGGRWLLGRPRDPGDRRRGVLAVLGPGGPSPHLSNAVAGRLRGRTSTLPFGVARDPPPLSKRAVLAAASGVALTELGRASGHAVVSRWISPGPSSLLVGGPRPPKTRARRRGFASHRSLPDTITVGRGNSRAPPPRPARPGPPLALALGLGLVWDHRFNQGNGHENRGTARRVEEKRGRSCRKSPHSTHWVRFESRNDLGRGGQAPPPHLPAVLSRSW